jgi:hypothetical protein
LADKA